MHKLRFTWDQKGDVLALAEPPDEILAHYLSEELGNDVRHCRRLLDIIRALRGGSHSAWQTEGDCWTVRLTRSRAVIESEFEVPGRSRELLLEEFEQLVESWMRFLELAR
jgi:hypothetical protein